MNMGNYCKSVLFKKKKIKAITTSFFWVPLFGGPRLGESHLKLSLEYGVRGMAGASSSLKRAAQGDCGSPSRRERGGKRWTFQSSSGPQQSLAGSGREGGDRRGSSLARRKVTWKESLREGGGRCRRDFLQTGCCLQDTIGHRFID